MKIIIDTVPHDTQRYNTIGDWQWFGETLQIKVSEMGNWRYEMIVAIHELAEILACKHNGVTEEVVDAFDLGHPELHEPGDSPISPYYKQHQIALAIEDLLIDALGIDEDAYIRKMDWLQKQRDAQDAIS